VRREPARARGLVLRLRPGGESDLYLDLFTAELGRTTALAKGGKRSLKRFCGLLLTGHFLDLTLAPTKSGDLWRLEAAALINPHLGLRDHWQRWIMAGPVLELLLRAMAPHDPHPGALALALNTLARLERAEGRPEMGTALAVFLVRLLAELGYGLEFAHCLGCGKEADRVRQPRLSLAGGLVCEDCPPRHRERPAPPGLVKSLGAAMSLPPEALGRLRLSPALLTPALEYLGEFWREVTERDLHSLELAGDVLREDGRGKGASASGGGLQPRP
jgi:DNA repair protein RecO (recombination protein O)